MAQLIRVQDKVLNLDLIEQIEIAPNDTGARIIFTSGQMMALGQTEAREFLKKLTGAGALK